MTKYLLKRLLHGLFSVIAVVIIVMLLVYSLMDRELIFAKDGTFTKRSANDREIYKYTQWEKYGYLEYDSFSDYLNMLVANGEIDQNTKAAALSYGKTADEDATLTHVDANSDCICDYCGQPAHIDKRGGGLTLRKPDGICDRCSTGGLTTDMTDAAVCTVRVTAVTSCVQRFQEYYEGRGYHVVRLDAVMLNDERMDAGGQQQLFAYRDVPLITRAWRYFTGLISVDNIHYAEEVQGERGITFTLHDPLAGGRFAPAIIGNGTQHKYLLYFDSNFPFVHQNVVNLKLGASYVVNKNIDVFDTMVDSQGGYVKSDTLYPTGAVFDSADDLHSATYVAGSRDLLQLYQERFTDDYTSVKLVKSNMSKIGFSFVIGLIAVVFTYLLGIPLGIVMARRKDKLVDKLGTIYIVFILAVPSLAYIFLFKAIGGAMGLPTSFDLEHASRLMYILPIVSLALPSVAGIMKWLRRYMIDQQNSDYVKFARSGGLSENEIFSKHILKNAIIPIVHGIPGSVLGALTGAIITERVYAVPGAGGLLTTAINSYDNAVIVGLTLFYSVLSVVSVILGDILMAMVDPRISFSEKAR